MPATIPNTLIIFGANPESYFLGHGRRYSFDGVPEVFAKQVQGTNLPVTQTDWIYFDLAGEKFIGYNDFRKQFCHSPDISEDLLNHIRASGATFVTLGNDDTYFIKHNNGGWNARLPNTHLQKFNDLKPHVGANFDKAIRGILFGHEQSHIFLFSGGFVGYLNAETQQDPDHPLTKVLVEFGQGWCLEPGSTLCPYSDRYFFLKFKKPKETVIQMRWSLPPLMSQKLAELKEQTESPEDQAFLAQLRVADMQKQQNENALAMQKLNIQRQMNDLNCQALINAGNSIKMATGDYVEVRRW
ncbi:hypothetical protein C8R44DRAFT_764193 [Mycena epipterygia]|nr:hypothetical protein C8R44DRAFT_764193 [Mycena epipterygia]